MAAYAALVSLTQIINQIQHHHPHPPIPLEKEQIESLTEKISFFQEFLECHTFHIGYSKEADGLENRIADSVYAAEDIIESQIMDQILAGSTTQGRKRISTVEFYQALNKVMEDMDLIKKDLIQIREKMGVQNKLHKSSTRAASTGQNSITVGLDDVVYQMMDKLAGGKLDLQIIPIHGMGGIGKTTLARTVYTKPVIKHYFDICAWATISQEYNTGEILSQLLNQESKEKGRRDSSDISEAELGEMFYKHLWGRRKLPPELEEIGKNIVKNCRGLPLSIVVIGGFLAKTKHARESWKYVEENLSTIVNSDDNESCLRILHMSYSHLPVYLKPCFLYMGVFEEDDVIRVSTLIKLWVAEGFIKPVSGKSSEVVAKEYLKDLIDRNLVLVDELGCTGNIKFCNIHDLLRDLCLREAQKERFYSVIRQHSLNLSKDIITQRRIVIPERLSPEKDVCDQFQSLSLVRSFICDEEGVTESFNFQLLRILKVYDRDSGNLDNQRFLENTFQFVNSKYLAVRACRGSKFPSSVYLLWNLQTLIVYSYHDSFLTAPTEIWKMPQLRHVEFCDGIYLPDPSNDNIILGNLHTLSTVINFKCSEEVVKKLPNITKLVIEYMEVEGRSCYFLKNLYRFDKLESFHCRSCPVPPLSGTDFLLNLTFSHSLRKVKLMTMHMHWEDMLEKIGSLPLLEKLTLMYGSFRTSKWETIGGQFPNLKFLEIYACADLECWTTESSHFPRLQCLNLQGLKELEEIPSDIGEIATLQLIELGYCSDSIIISAKQILEDRQELGEVGLQVRVSLKGNNQVVENLASPNFQVECD
ncbi:hypothetical protein C2S51_011788 [Perilla frutescens var. frutescens]|nr:hypothetical protein C2S51_011788 [Perilla frutescens var. frutescens]